MRTSEPTVLDGSRPPTTTWNDVLSGIDTLNNWDLICFADLPITGFEACIICDSRDLGPGLDLPPDATALGYARCLLGEQIGEVVQNARLQVTDPDRRTLYRAVRYYFDNDAFLALDDPTKPSNPQASQGDIAGR
jgi:hypothetical protein